MEKTIAVAKIKHLMGTLLIYSVAGVALNLSLYCEKKYYRRKHDNWFLSGSPDPTYRIYSKLDETATPLEKRRFEIDLLFPSILPVTVSEVEHRDKAISLFTNVIRQRISDHKEKEKYY